MHDRRPNSLGSVAQQLGGPGGQSLAGAEANGGIIVTTPRPVRDAITSKRVNWIVDADIEGFLDALFRAG